MLDIKERYFTNPGEITKRCDLLETYDRNKHNKDYFHGKTAFDDMA